MDKKDYLFKTLSRTKRKDSENYVINAIYQRLNNLDIEIVSQQCVIKKDRNHYLMDLYFPQINYAIECYEHHHKHTFDYDKNREEDIQKVFQAINEKGIKFINIETYNVTIEQLNKKIDKAVEMIKKKYIEVGSPKRKIEDPVDVCKRRGYIDNKDRLIFRTHADVLKLFGYNYKAYQLGAKKISNDKMVWFPKMAIQKDERYISADKKWFNRISLDHMIIYETKLEKRTTRENDNDYTRYVFGKVKNELGIYGYKFLGIYKCIDIKRQTVTFKKIRNRLNF